MWTVWLWAHFLTSPSFCSSVKWGWLFLIVTMRLTVGIHIYYCYQTRYKTYCGRKKELCGRDSLWLHLHSSCSVLSSLFSLYRSSFLSSTSFSCIFSFLPGPKPYILLPCKIIHSPNTVINYLLCDRHWVWCWRRQKFKHYTPCSWDIYSLERETKIKQNGRHTVMGANVSMMQWEHWGWSSIYITAWAFLPRKDKARGEGILGGGHSICEGGETRIITGILETANSEVLLKRKMQMWEIDIGDCVVEAFRTNKWKVISIHQHTNLLFRYFSIIGKREPLKNFDFSQ